MNDKLSVPQIVHSELCVSCGHCIAVCPKASISHSDFPRSNIKPVNHRSHLSLNQLLELFRTRRSIRSFKQKPVEDSLLKKIIEGARFAPSTNNIQSTEYIIVKDKIILKNITEMTVKYLDKFVKTLHNPITRNLWRILSKDSTTNILERIPEYVYIVNAYQKNQDLILHNAPVLLFFHAKKSIGFSNVNADLALQNALLAIHGLGLGSFYAGYVTAACQKETSIPRLLNIPNDHRIYGCLAIGYPKLIYDNWIERKPPQIKWM